MGHGGAEILVRIDGDALDSDFVVKVGRCDAAGGAHVSDDLSAADVLAGGDGESGKVSVTSGDTVAVIDGDEASVSAHEFGGADDTVACGVDRSAVRNGNINAAMECAFSVEGIDTLTERAGEAALDGPEGWRIGGAGPIRERSEAAIGILKTGGGGSGERGTTERVERIERGLILSGLHVVIARHEAGVGLEAVEG